MVDGRYLTPVDCDYRAGSVGRTPRPIAPMLPKKQKGLSESIKRLHLTAAHASRLSFCSYSILISALHPPLSAAVGEPQSLTTIEQLLRPCYERIAVWPLASSLSPDCTTQG